MFDLTGDATLLVTSSSDYHNYGIGVFPLGMRHSSRGTIFTNGKIGASIRLSRQIVANERPVFVGFSQQKYGVSVEVTVRIQDTNSAIRLIEYLRSYYGQTPTNCSTLAKFLYSGDFTPVCLERFSMMFDKYMVPYKGQKIGVGDVVCVLFSAHERKNKGRMSPLRKHYRETKGTKTVLVENKDSQYPASPERIIELYKTGCVEDFHFLTCIANYKGEQVYVCQDGLHTPVVDHVQQVPILFSLGAYNPPGRVPLATFIRKRKYFF